MTGNGVYLGAGSAVTKGLYHLEGNSNDSSGNANNGTDTAITYGLPYGFFGQGISSNGTTSKIVSGSNCGISGDAVFTLLAWVKIGADIITPRCIVSFGSFASSLAGAGMVIGVAAGASGTFINGNGNISLECGGGNGARTTTGIVSVGQRCLIAITKSAGGLSTNTSIYLNGLLIPLSTSSTGTPNITNGIIGISHLVTSSNFFDGYTDEVILENVLWSAAKVKKYYTYAKGRFGL